MTSVRTIILHSFTLLCFVAVRVSVSLLFYLLAMAYYRGFFGVVPGVWVFRVFEQAVFTSTRDTHEKKKQQQQLCT